MKVVPGSLARIRKSHPHIRLLHARSARGSQSGLVWTERLYLELRSEAPVQLLSPARYKVQFTASASFCDKLEP